MIGVAYSLPIHFLYDGRELPSAEGGLKSCSLGSRVRELSDPVGEHLSFEGRFFPSSVSGCGEVEDPGEHPSEGRE